MITIVLLIFCAGDKCSIKESASRDLALLGSGRWCPTRGARRPGAEFVVSFEWSRNGRYRRKERDCSSFAKSCRVGGTALFTPRSIDFESPKPAGGLLSLWRTLPRQRVFQSGKGLLLPGVPVRP